MQTFPISRMIRKLNPFRKRKRTSAGSKLVFVFGPLNLAPDKRINFLYRLPQFQQVVDQCDGVVRKYRGWSPLEVLIGNSRADQITKYEKRAIRDVIVHISLC